MTAADDQARTGDEGAGTDEGVRVHAGSDEHAGDREARAMIRRYLMTLRVGLMVVDGVVATAVFLGAAAVRFAGDGGGVRGIWRALHVEPWLLAVTFAILWVSVLWVSGLYRLNARWRVWTEVRDLARATVLVVAISLSALFLVNFTAISRLYLVYLFVAVLGVTLAGRLLVRAAFNWNRAQGRDPRYMLVVGTGQLAQDFADRVEAHAGLGLRIVGHLSAPNEPDAVVTRPILGSINELHDVFRDQVVDEVAICLPPAASRLLEPIASVASGEGKTVRIAVDPIEELLPGAVQEEFEGILVRSLVNDGQREVGLIVKRAIDVVGSAVGLVLLSPLLLFAAIAIRLRDGSPILFLQERVGLHGRPFTMVKFRTMVVDAEDRLDEVRHMNERNGAAFKATNDPRITKVGGFLRRTSIDELPQLWNVLTGSMSLVGPRPPLPDEVAEYDVWHRRRLSMKPGITGLWQVEARHDPDFDRWVEHDLIYIDGWSIWLDFKILLRTLPALLVHGGR
jgi:exopolysaccharide biosynthesis polyprenyl glycosylphosphotransferase